jgi:hypothetical protein
MPPGWAPTMVRNSRTHMRALDGLALDLAPRQSGIGTRCLPLGAYWIMLLLMAIQALCPSLASNPSVAASAALQPLVSAVQQVNLGTDVRDPLDAQSAASAQLNPVDNDRAGSASMQAGDEVDPNDDGFAAAFGASSPLLSLPTGALAPRLEPRRLLGRSDAPPDRPPTSAA